VALGLGLVVVDVPRHRIADAVRAVRIPSSQGGPVSGQRVLVAADAVERARDGRTDVSVVGTGKEVAVAERVTDVQSGEVVRVQLLEDRRVHAEPDHEELMLELRRTLGGVQRVAAHLHDRHAGGVRDDVDRPAGPATLVASASKRLRSLVDVVEERRLAVGRPLDVVPFDVSLDAADVDALDEANLFARPSDVRDVRRQRVARLELRPLMVLSCRGGSGKRQTEQRRQRCHETGEPQSLTH
jgi:hypothetical protein